MSKTKPIIYVRDDNGHAWYFRDGKIRLVLAELEISEGEERNESGYFCDNLEQGIERLNQFGYITGVEYDDNYIEDYGFVKSDTESNPQTS